MASMRELANHIIAVANRNERTITNLQLQKIMFFVFGRIVKTYGTSSDIVNETYDIPFEKWSYGPVVEDIYFEYNRFGGRPIRNAEVEESEDYLEFNDRILNLLKVNPFKMVEITHKLDSWADYEEDIQMKRFVPPYNLEEFEREFR